MRGATQMIRQIGTVLGWAVLATIATGLPGCKSFLDPSEVVREQGDRLMVPILSSLDPVDEPAPQFATAQDPSPDDLKPASTDYIIGPNDLLTVSVLDLVNSNVETVRSTRVSEGGMISLPMISTHIKAGGLTEAQLQKLIVDRYRAENIIQNAQVAVTVTEATQRTFSILGDVKQPGVYMIRTANFRVLDALVSAGDLATDTSDYIYVIRQRKQDKPTAEVQPATEPTKVPAAPADPLAPKAQVNRRSGPVLAVGGMSSGGAISPKPAAAPRPVIQTAQATDAAADEPARYIYLDGKPKLNPTTDATAEKPVAARPAVVEEKPAVVGSPAAVAAPVPVPAPVPTPEPAVSEAAGASAPTEAQQPTANAAFEFGAGYVEDTRVIRIPIKQLKGGDIQYNIVIRPGDTILSPSPATGEYYIGGHVQSPGAYSLTGRDINLKQAVISARMLDQLAIPSRTDVIRRIGKDKEIFVRVDLEKIFEGRQPDIYLKPNDQVLVGTNALAPFLSALRGAFRFTYGFGFIYDRNFAYDSGYYESNNR